MEEWAETQFLAYSTPFGFALGLRDNFTAVLSECCRGSLYEADLLVEPETPGQSVVICKECSTIQEHLPPALPVVAAAAHEESMLYAFISHGRDPLEAVLLTGELLEEIAAVRQQHQV